MNTHRITRREALTRGAGLAISPALLTFAGDEQRRFKIGACDWSIGRGGQLSALELAKQIGLDGVQVSFGKPGVEFDLRSEGVRRLYEQAAEKDSVDFPRVKDAIDDIGYRGWLVIESAVGKGRSVHDSYVHNQKYLRSVFL